MLDQGGKGRGNLAMKICLAGENGVGKSSLVHRFVSNIFDDRYIATLGAKVSSRTYSVMDPLNPRRSREVNAAIWDIMGHEGFREVFKESYFVGTQGLLLVCDGTRPRTLATLPAWSSAAKTVAGTMATVVLVNKSDLGAEVKIKREDVEELCVARGWRWLPTSAKTGENVDAAFTLVAELYLQSLKTVRPGIPTEP